MDPKYSILLCNQSLVEYERKIKNWLLSGIKVLWFGREDEVFILKDKYQGFAKAFLVQAYSTSIREAGVIIDGEGKQDLFNKISDDCRLFNSAQYQVEHCKVDDHIVKHSIPDTINSILYNRYLLLIIFLFCLLCQVQCGPQSEIW